MKRITGSLLVIFLVYTAVCSISGCAQMIPPTGGPRDSIPPMLVAAMPKDSTLNFTGKKIVLAFDEYIQVEKAQEEVIFSPTPKIAPIIEAKLREVTITLKDTLEENTTYSINFGRSLKDLNEGNPYKNFTYLFSTGSYLDSGSLQGKVVIANTGKPDSTLTILLHKDRYDSAVAKERPRYYSKLDSSGRFFFKNIAPGTYDIFALKDQGGQRLYLRGTDLFAFYDSSITVGGHHTIQPVLYAFTEEEDRSKTGRPGSNSGKPRTGPSGKGKGPAKEKKLNYTTSLESNKQDLLSDLVLTFSDSLVSFDPGKLHFIDTLNNPVTGYSLEPDTSGKVIHFKYPWQEDQSFKLVLEQEIAADSSGLQLAKNDTLSFVTKKKSDYGSLKIRLINLDTSQHIVLQFYKTDKLDQSKAATGKEINFPLFIPGEYEIRLLYDRNGNGKWDTGNYWSRIQPEKIVTIPKKNNIRANWDNEITLELPVAPPPDVLQ